MTAASTTFPSSGIHHTSNAIANTTSQASPSISNYDNLNAVDWAIITLPADHPAPWYYQEELCGDPVPARHQADDEPYTDDARRHHVVRDANGNVIVHCSKFSKCAEEQLARAIAAIPTKEAELKQLRSINAELNAKLHAALNPAEAPSLAAILQSENTSDAQISIATRRFIETYMRALDCLRILAEAAGLHPNDGIAPTIPTRGMRLPDTRPPGYSHPWDYKEEPDFEG